LPTDRLIDDIHLLNLNIMQITKEIARHIREIHFGDNWTWVAMQETLKDVNWQQAIARPVKDGNSIAALVFHMNYYLRIVHQRLAGVFPEFEQEDSFRLPEIRSENDWQALLQKTWDDAESFARAVEQFPDERLGDDISPQYGSFYKNLHGVVEHNHYHLGQIVLLKKL
jgi:hypothetical protein